MTRWRCWYAGGGVFEGETREEFDELPPVGFLMLMRDVPGGREQVSMGDWYWSVETGPDEWLIARVPTALEIGDHAPPPGNVPADRLKMGVMVSDEEWGQVLLEAGLTSGS